MKQENKKTWVGYAVCLGIEGLLAFLVIWSKGFFTQSLQTNLGILADAFFVPGILMTLFSGLLFVSGEGALIGIGFVLRNVVLAFIPMGRARHERYADYRERKLAKGKKGSSSYITVTGLSFLAVGVILTLIYYLKFYSV